MATQYLEIPEVLAMIAKYIHGSTRLAFVCVSSLWRDVGAYIFDPADDDNDAIKEACARGLTVAVRHLLLDSRVDPAVDNSWCFGLAATSGHADVMRLLLSDPRINPAMNSNLPLLTASLRGHAHVVDLLLSDSRVSDEGCGTIPYMARSARHNDIANTIEEHFRDRKRKRDTV